jgi:outer membrane protein TolC
VAVANAQQQGLQAHADSLGSRAQLMATIGIPATDAGDITLLEPAALIAAGRQPPAPLGTLRAQAHQRRPEVLQLQHLVLSADHETRARTFALIPDVDIEAAYTRLDGQIFAPKNSAYLGVRANWAVWEWGSTYYQQRAASARAAAARRDVEAMDRQIESEVDASLALGDAARGAVDAADTATVSAAEAYRVTQAQVKAGTATTTDLLESQAALTQARLNQTRAVYELALARINLDHAAGSP